MVIKGRSTSEARQLANRLRRATSGEIIKVLELRAGWVGPCGHAATENLAADLARVFLRWQTVAKRTTHGRRGLYHATISREADRGPITREQWIRAADILGEELGLQGQPRALILRDFDTCQNLHIIWQRTDMATWMLRPDSNNYHAHDQASHRIELEFGHPTGRSKCLRRGRPLKTESARCTFAPDELRRAKRTGVDVYAMQAEVIALKAAARTSETFRAGLEAAGYVLAKGYYGYTIVDRQGGIYSLARVLGLRLAALNQFMNAITLGELPSIRSAKARQKRERAPSETGFAKTSSRRQVSRGERSRPKRICHKSS